MTTTTARSRALPQLALGVATIALMIAAFVVGLLVGPEARVDAGDLVLLSIVTGTAVLVWGAVMWLAREPDAGNRAAVGSVVIGALGMLSTVAFWLDIPLVLGVGAVLLGRLGSSRADRGAGRRPIAHAGLVCGVLALALWIGAYAFVQDW